MMTGIEQKFSNVYCKERELVTVVLKQCLCAVQLYVEARGRSQIRVESSYSNVFENSCLPLTLFQEELNL